MPHERLDPPWSLFRRKGEALACAVPQGRPRPGFLDAGAWEAAGAIVGPGDAPPGFDEPAAGFAFRFQGFYIFREAGGRRAQGAGALA